MSNEWNMQALEQAYLDDLNLCRSPHERLMCRTLASMEIRKRATDLAAQGRLTPGGQAIAAKYGWNLA